MIDGESVPSQHVEAAIQSSAQQASGELHDCSDFLVDSESTCPGAEGKICLFSFDVDSEVAWAWKVSNQAEQSGCVALVAFMNTDEQIWLPTHADTELRIPFVYVSKENGQKILDSQIGMTASIEVSVFGAGCFIHWGWEEETLQCSDNIPCDVDTFCEYKNNPLSEDRYSQGYCTSCPKDALSCYFDIHDADTVQNTESCFAACNAEEEFTGEKCKFCTSQLTEFKFGVDDEADRCVFCQQDDVQYPDRVVSLIGENVTCSKLDSFFKRLPVSKETSNCELIKSVNYICGCEGVGYAGANTQSKQNALVWVPRVTAILSVLVRVYNMKFLVHSCSFTVRDALTFFITLLLFHRVHCL